MVGRLSGRIRLLDGETGALEIGSADRGVGPVSDKATAILNDGG